MARTSAIRELAIGDLSAAIGVVARGMRDNPLHIAAFGEDATVRAKHLQRMFKIALPAVKCSPATRPGGWRRTSPSCQSCCGGESRKPFSPVSHFGMIMFRVHDARIGEKYIRSKTQREESVRERCSEYQFR
jgi:hypothetical protein